MSRQRDPLELVDATLLTRYSLLMIAGLFILAGAIGGGYIITWFALFVMAAGLISFSITFHGVRATTVKRIMPNNRGFENSLATVTARVENRSIFASFLVQMEDRFPPSGHERQLVNMRLPVMPNVSYMVPLEFHCTSKRGRYTIGPLRLVAYDLFGFYTLVAADEQQYDFFVYPPPFALIDFPLQGIASRFSFGTYTNPRIGNGLEFASIREYRDFDDTRRIHWPATARTGQLMLKEFEQTGAVRVTLFFDLSKASVAGIGRHCTSEYAIKIAGSIARYALDEGHQVQLLAEGDRLVYLPLGSGSWHFTSVMQELARVRADGKRPLYDLIDAYVELVPEDSNAILIFSKCDIDVDAYLNAIQLLRSRKVRITAIILDHTSFLPVYEIHNFERATAAQQTLMRQGVTVHFIRQGDDLPMKLSLPLAVEAEGVS